TPEQLHRYSRQILLKEIGVEGQVKLSRAKVLVAGAGGLGSPAALYLAAAGVGSIDIVDSDLVDVSNLQRQIAHTSLDIGRAKAESAAERMLAINPELCVRPLHTRLCADNIMSIIRGYDFVLDGTDNFPTKFLLNDACVLAGIPLSHGGVLRFEGQTMTILPGRSACYRCVFRQPPLSGAVSSCSEAGILGAVAGMLGIIQTAEALKYITDAGDLLTNILLRFDALKMDFRRIPLTRQEDCPVCGKTPAITEPVDIPWSSCENADR
ncbi:MAG: HesA/MoeB/ThiF family protein, partial [Desulfobulbales bacterium]